MTVSDSAIRGIKASTTNKTLPYPLNTWYVAAWDHEATKAGILARTVAGRPMAIYRTDDGRPVALAEACWHRLAPLSMGKRVRRGRGSVPLPRAKVQLGGPLHLHAGLGDDQPQRHGAVLPRRRALPVHLGVAG